MDLRCPAKKHAELLTPSTDEGVIEVKCRSRWCGAESGVVVTHQFNTSTGELMGTKKFRQPITGG
jgi:hypothetical protein